MRGFMRGFGNRIITHARRLRAYNHAGGKHYRGVLALKVRTAEVAMKSTSATNVTKCMYTRYCNHNVSPYKNNVQIKLLDEKFNQRLNGH